MQSKIFCLVGGSGSGKDTIKEQLGLPYIVSYRTRPKRKHEIDGVHGHFVDYEMYNYHKTKDMVAGETLYNGYYYWTTQFQFKDYYDNESPQIYVVDGEGVETLRKVFPSQDVIGIYIDVNENELIDRMITRGDSRENIESRMDYFKTIAEKDKTICDYVVDNNGDLVYTLNQIYKIIVSEVFNT